MAGRGWDAGVGGEITMLLRPGASDVEDFCNCLRLRRGAARTLP